MIVSVRSAIMGLLKNGLKVFPLNSMQQILATYNTSKSQLLVECAPTCLHIFSNAF